MVTAGEWVRHFVARVEAQHPDLSDLDRLAGDGDFGDNLLGATRRAARLMDNGTDGFDALYRSFLESGGTSGPLLAIWFRPFRALVGEIEDGDQLARAGRSGLEGVQSAAGAQVGDNTMVDAMVPAVAALEVASGVTERLVGAARQARLGAESTVGLLGRKGRSSYVGGHAVGVMDPGALAIAWFFEASNGTGACA